MLIEDEKEDELLDVLKQYLEKYKKEVATDNKVKLINLDVNAQDINGWTIMITAIINKLSNIQEVVKLLLELGADPSISSRDGKNAFHWAARTGNALVIETISEQLPYMKIKELLNTPSDDSHKMKPTHLAARFDHSKAFQVLLILEQKNRNF
jgi:ankyrin repeat protein